MRQQNLFSNVEIRESFVRNPLNRSEFDDQAIVNLETILNNNQIPTIECGPNRRTTADNFQLGDLMSLGFMEKIKRYEYVVTGDIKFRMKYRADLTEIVGKGEIFHLIGFK